MAVAAKDVKKNPKRKKRNIGAIKASMYSHQLRCWRKVGMQKAMIYIHGKDGTASEAEHYRALFNDSDIIGFDYQSVTPWEAKEEFQHFFDSVRMKYQGVFIVANSIGAFFTMHALADRNIEKAFFISPIVNMEKLISNMMIWANVTEDQLQREEEIQTNFGETLSWKYLCYVREHPITWHIPTKILFGEKDHLTSYDTMSDFATKMGIPLTVMHNGEHWFHTDEQMKFLDDWIRDRKSVV